MSKNSGIRSNIIVVCDDQSILDRVNGLLCRDGIVSLSDVDGKTQYLVDARNKRELSANKLDLFIDSVSSCDVQMKAIIEEILMEFGFNFALIGTRIYADLVRDTVMEMDFSKNMQQYYSVISEHYGMSILQVERNVRYAISKSRLPDWTQLRTYISRECFERVLLSKHKSKNLHVIRILAQIALDRYNKQSTK
ncbi:MAG: sporulation initiation factor Spo0A C-terminal domain-containing protein [Clostridia bacterium]|nr:sporulation initiation factor Spo0A C-terminal domain-containing protein [Clostridia bacterium]